MGSIMWWSADNVPGWSESGQNLEISGCHCCPDVSIWIDSRDEKEASANVNSAIVHLNLGELRDFRDAVGWAVEHLENQGQPVTEGGDEQ